VASRMHHTVGHLARATGLTVRTLHHWDEIGLLRPAERSGAGHRHYSDADVRRLYRIVALRRLGLSLEDVAGALAAEGDDLREAVAAHLAEVERRLAAQRELRRRLMGILDAFDRLDGPSTDQIIDAIEVMTMSERYYSPEQLEQLAERRERLGDARIRDYEQEWAELLAALERERAAGADPAEAGVQALAERWRELIAAFTGGDAGLHDSLNRMYAEEGVERASRGAVSSELWDYARRALDVLTRDGSRPSS
jgi:MerR family transcriptional regulator, thiopeptide resistance regulator